MKATRRTDTSQEDTEAEYMILSLGLGEPKLWPEILARGVGPDVVCSPFVAGMLRYVKRAVHESGVLPGLADMSLLAGDEMERRQLIQCRAHFPGVDSLPIWCDRIVSLAQRRALVRAARTLGRAALDGSAPPAEVARDALADIVASVRPAAGTQIETPTQWAESFAEELAKRQAGEVEAMTTGFPTLDRNLVIRGGDLVLIAAETGVGKSALALSMGRSAASAGLQVVYVNTEMDDYTVQSRIVGAEAGVPVDRLLSGKLSDVEADLARIAAKRLVEAGTMNLSRLAGFVHIEPAELMVAVRAHHTEHGLDLFVLDYVGRLDTTGTRADDREYLVLERAVRDLKRLAQDLGIVVYVLVQRTWDGHLAGSKRMRNEADLVLELIPREPDDEPAGPGATHNLEITKCRNWRSGLTIGTRFDATHMRFEEVGVRATR